MVLRRTVAVVLGLLVVPSIALFFDALARGKALLPWVTELIFVACCLIAAAAAWVAVRYWPLIVLAVASLYTYIITGPLIAGPLLSTPGSYVSSVLREAERRGFGADGAWLIWSLLVLPAAFPIILALSVWLCIALRPSRDARAI